MLDFEKIFKQLTEHDPFDWQKRLFQKFLNGTSLIPAIFLPDWARLL